MFTDMDQFYIRGILMSFCVSKVHRFTFSLPRPWRSSNPFEPLTIVYLHPAPPEGLQGGTKGSPGWRRGPLPRPPLSQRRNRRPKQRGNGLGAENDNKLQKLLQRFHEQRKLLKKTQESPFFYQYGNGDLILGHINYIKEQ